MDFSTVARLPAGEKPATLFVALELSKATWLVALHSPAADKISLHRLAGGDTQGLLTLIERKRDQAQTALARPVHVISCYEAGYDGFWLHRLGRPPRGGPGSMLVHDRSWRYGWGGRRSWPGLRSRPQHNLWGGRSVAQR